MSDTDIVTVLLDGQSEARLQADEPPAKSSAASKSHTVIKLLRRTKGVTIAEVQDATAWQPHSVRAFLSGLRKKGSAVTKEQRKSGETAYRLSAKAAPAGAVDA